MKNIHRQLLEYILLGERIVLATVVKTSGSTPQKPGSSALFGERGLIAGTIGGGQLEGDVAHIAKHALVSGISGQYYFNLDSDQGGDGAICGGEAEVLVDANPAIHKVSMEEMEIDLSDRTEGAICTLVSKDPSKGLYIERYWIRQEESLKKPGEINPGPWDSIVAHLSRNRKPEFCEPELSSGPEGNLRNLYIETMKPMPHLVIAGAGHVGRALAHLASLLDFEITVVDDRQEFACRENIPDADRFIVKDIGLAMTELQPGPDTYIVIVTRGHSNDAEALKPLVESEAAYLGMIGSRNKVAIMKKQFIDRKLVTEEQWAGIHTPIGIPIGSKTVQEIAISIAAELVSERDQNLNNET